jgi:hypothetical protein
MQRTCLRPGEMMSGTLWPRDWRRLTWDVSSLDISLRCELRKELRRRAPLAARLLERRVMTELMLLDWFEKFIPFSSPMGDDGSENTSRLSVLCFSFSMVSFSGVISGKGDRTS